MDDIKIDEQEEHLEIQKAVEEDTTEEEVSSDGKTIVIAIVIIFGIFILSFGGFKLYENLTTEEVLDVDQLHQENLEGELNENDGYIYNGFSFVKVDGLWWTEVNIANQRVKIPLHFGPKDVDNITTSGKLSESFSKSNQIYVSIDPEVISGHYVIAMKELSSNMAQGLGRNSVGACSKNASGCEDREILNCENPNGKSVVELVESDETSIEFSGTCIKVQGQDYEIIKAANKLLYMWYGIIK